MAEGIENRGWYNGPKINMWFNVLTFLPFLSKEINMYAFIEEVKERKGTNETHPTTLVHGFWCRKQGLGGILWIVGHRTRLCEEVYLYFPPDILVVTLML